MFLEIPDETHILYCESLVLAGQSLRKEFAFDLEQKSDECSLTNLLRVLQDFPRFSFTSFSATIGPILEILGALKSYRFILYKKNIFRAIRELSKIA